MPDYFGMAGREEIMKIKCENCRYYHPADMGRICFNPKRAKALRDIGIGLSPSEYMIKENGCKFFRKKEKKL